LVPERIQMLHRRARGCGVVDVDAGNAQRVVDLASVDDRRDGPQLADDRARGRRKPVAEDDHAVGLVAREHLRVALFAFGLVLGVAEQDRVAGRLRGFLRALEDLGEERVADVRHRDQDLAAALGLERPGRRVGDIAQRDGRLLDALARGRQHLLRAGQRARHRACRDADVLGDVVDGCHSRPGSFRCGAQRVPGSLHARIMQSIASRRIGMRTLQGPALFLAQFIGDTPPFDRLDTLAGWAAGLGYRGVQVPTGAAHIFDLEQAAHSQAYCDDMAGMLATHGIRITELSTHLKGQLVAVPPAYDALFDGFAPEDRRGDPAARQAWAVEQVTLAARASQRLGLKAHATFSGALAWPYFYPWPQRPPGLVDEAFAELGRRW